MNDGLTLSNGRHFYANCGIIGIDAECESISEGYDGSIAHISDIHKEPGEFDKPATREEMIEIADIMIKRWTDFKGKLKQ